MKKSMLTSLLSAILVMVMVLSLAGCNAADNKTAETKATTAATQAQTEKATEAAAQDATQAATQAATDAAQSNDTDSNTTDGPVIEGNLTGIWKNVSNPDGASITVSSQNGNTIHITITAVRGENAQIATFEDDIMLSVEPTDTIHGFAEFVYTDSFGNTGKGQITASEANIMLSITEEERNSSWGISGTGGKYILYSTL